MLKIEKTTLIMQKEGKSDTYKIKNNKSDIKSN